MELKVYNWERFERGKTRYLVYTFVILLVIILSILSKNIIWWVLVLIIAGIHIFYTTKVNDVIKIRNWKQWLQVWKSILSRVNLSWFVLEYHTEKKKIHNIVILDDKKVPRIFTIKDTDKNLENFVKELSWFIPMLEKYDQSTFDRFIRKIKL